MKHLLNRKNISSAWAPVLVRRGVLLYCFCNNILAEILKMLPKLVYNFDTLRLPYRILSSYTATKYMKGIVIGSDIP